MGSQDIVSEPPAIAQVEADASQVGPIQHGGNQLAIRKRLGLGDRPLVDFSAPLNGFGPPPGVLPAVRRAVATLDRYPEPGAPRLVERLAEFHGVPADRIVVGAGTTELISLIGQSLREALALHARELGDPDMPLAHLIEPSYSEYRRTSVLNELRAQIWPRHILGWDQDFLPLGASGIFWTGHPNNPTGRAWDRDRLLNLVDRSHGLLTVVDEAYLAFLPDEAERTIIQDVVERENLLCLRSMTKIYGIPGMRIGYAVASPDMVERLRQYQEPWTITAYAEAAALAALDDDEYLQRTVAHIQAEAPRMTERLWDIPGVRPAWPGRERPASAPPPVNFVLVSLTDTPWTSIQVHEELARRGFLVRECSNYRGLEVDAVLTGPDQIVATRGHLRFTVRSREENDRLLDTLAAVLASAPPDRED